MNNNKRVFSNVDFRTFSTQHTPIDTRYIKVRFENFFDTKIRTVRTIGQTKQSVGLDLFLLFFAKPLITAVLARIFKINTRIYYHSNKSGVCKAYDVGVKSENQRYRVRVSAWKRFHVE